MSVPLFIIPVVLVGACLALVACAITAAVLWVVNAPDAEPVPPIDADTIRVHATLAPRGLIAVGGVLRPALWSGTGPGPRRGEVVHATAPTDGLLWLATTIGSPSTSEGRNAPPEEMTDES